MKTITRDALRALLARVNHSTFATFTALTRVPTPVGAPVIRKLSRVNVCVGRYESAVNRRRAKEGVTAEPFVAQPRRWGTYVPGSICLVQHSKDGALKHYLSAQVLKARDPIYLREEPPVRRGGRPRLIGVAKEEIAHLLPPDKTAQVAAAQSVETPIIHRDYDLANLSCVSLGGEVYHVTDSP